jgi:hypothetical protein
MNSCRLTLIKVSLQLKRNLLILTGEKLMSLSNTNADEFGDKLKDKVLLENLVLKLREAISCIESSDNSNLLEILSDFDAIEDLKIIIEIKKPLKDELEFKFESTIQPLPQACIKPCIQQPITQFASYNFCMKLKNGSWVPC